MKWKKMGQAYFQMKWDVGDHKRFQEAWGGCVNRGIW